MCYIRHSKRTRQCQLGGEKQPDPTRLSLFRSTPAENLGLHASDKISEYWVLIWSILYSAGLVSCALTRRVLTPRISPECLHLLD